MKRLMLSTILPLLLSLTPSQCFQLRPLPPSPSLSQISPSHSSALRRHAPPTGPLTLAHAAVTADLAEKVSAELGRPEGMSEEEFHRMLESESNDIEYGVAVMVGGMTREQFATFKDLILTFWEDESLKGAAGGAGDDMGEWVLVHDLPVARITKRMLVMPLEECIYDAMGVDVRDDSSEEDVEVPPVIILSGLWNFQILKVVQMYNALAEQGKLPVDPAWAKVVPNAIRKRMSQLLGEIQGDHVKAGMGEPFTSGDLSSEPIDETVEKGEAKWWHFLLEKMLTNNKMSDEWQGEKVDVSWANEPDQEEGEEIDYNAEFRQAFWLRQYLEKGQDEYDKIRQPAKPKELILREMAAKEAEGTASAPSSS
ncbi:unnamed protein product [Vitrella brassicaformis CCMP3155]|uniref:Uncharacterized protein n=1 Tax=Vitrella brassicaformis (strain CCMP3155) TaxID=1169540 RepID=A0A0G4G678_VITBC|nr:unnamed protein product [Vitrella brassicaformis CCMP3155]|eukprot:CEM23757.1 unnamed protein product [Vitrella brassicaformis CCMP3155]